MNAKEAPQKELRKIIVKSNSQLQKVRKEVEQLRSILQHNESIDIKILKRYNGILKIENIEQTDENNTYNAKVIRIYSKSQPSEIIFEMIYSGSGIIVSFGSNHYIEGIYLAKFSDFDCNNLIEIIYNKYSLTKVLSYHINIDGNNSLHGTIDYLPREDMSIVGKFFNRISR